MQPAGAQPPAVWAALCPAENLSEKCSSTQTQGERTHVLSRPGFQPCGLELEKGPWKGVLASGAQEVNVRASHGGSCKTGNRGNI